MKKFAVPIAGDVLTPHFGHCEKFAIIETENKRIIRTEFLDPPVHQPGVYPQFLSSQGVSTILAAGMGMKARDLFSQKNIEVFTGVSSGTPECLVEQYLLDHLQTGENTCDHSGC